MSRIGKKPIIIPSGADVSINGQAISVKGPKGSLSFGLRPEIDVKIVEDQLQVEIIKPSRASSAYMGMTRSLINNMVKGVSEGFEKKLELVGVGYRAKMNGKDLGLTVGYSHPVEFIVPAGIEIAVTDNQFVSIKGFDKQLVGQVAANIRKIRKPEPYKGKGIKYSTEVVRRKQGKSGKV